ncbi:LysR family transcriptional regulator [Motiliproteus sp. SC1-56]|uniref:LysR family transcriptional regulator n=1 Tax=Motiliproteus sp. SC1-56 TaxID=2799565 RepID=UPI001A8C518E|nr:LysR family transcriptional regulator [Motiliproteus sp. SC1-56]
MELRWLEDFCALARTRHFSRAAEEQNVTQPTFSRRIKMLEEEVGVMLIDRNTLPLSLTPAGELFCASAQRIIEIVRDTREQCLDLERAEAQKLKFATNQTLYLSFFQPWFEALESDVEMAVNLQSTAWMGSDFVQALQSGDCDLILCYWHPAIDFLQVLEGEAYSHLVVAEETLVPVTARDSQGQPKFWLPGSDRGPLPYISYNAKTFIAPVIADHLRRLPTPPHLLSVNENSQAISVKAMVAQGYGLGWLPRRILESGDSQGLVAAGDASWEIPLQLRLYRLARNRHGALERLWQQAAQQTQFTETPV